VRKWGAFAAVVRLVACSHTPSPTVKLTDCGVIPALGSIGVLGRVQATGVVENVHGLAAVDVRIKWKYIDSPTFESGFHQVIAEDPQPFTQGMMLIGSEIRLEERVGSGDVHRVDLSGLQEAVTGRGR
jgi:hypothetical protein